MWTTFILEICWLTRKGFFQFCLPPGFDPRTSWVASQSADRYAMPLPQMVSNYKLTIKVSIMHDNRPITSDNYKWFFCTLWKESITSSISAHSGLPVRDSLIIAHFVGHQDLANNSTSPRYLPKTHCFGNYMCMNLWKSRPSYLTRARVEYLYFRWIWL